jgi:hypothetical protein
MENIINAGKYKILIINTSEDKINIVKSFRELSILLSHYNINKSHMYFQRYFSKINQNGEKFKSLFINNIIINMLSF